MTSVSVLLVDDEALIRSGLRLLLDGTDGITVIGEAADGHEALDLVGATTPDIALVDIRMPGMDGLATTEALSAQYPAVKVIILTTFDNDHTVLSALRAGAVGFLLKDTNPQDLIAAITGAQEGRIPLSPAITRQLIEHAVGAHDLGVKEQALAQWNGLSVRERAIALAVATGATNAEIAAQEFVSVATVKTQLASAMAKLRATNRVQVALRCYEAGLL